MKISRLRNIRWSKVVLLRGNYKCAYCGGEGTDPSHIVSRRKRKTRYILENGICLCRKHHIMFDSVQKFRKHIIEIYIMRELYNKLLEVSDGKSDYARHGFTVIG